MFKKFSAALLFSATSALCSAGIIDYGDTSFLPDVNSYSTVRKIVAKYYPEFTVYLPEGLSRHDAWVSDIKKAAEIIRNTYDDLPAQEGAGCARTLAPSWPQLRSCLAFAHRPQASLGRA